MNNILIINLLRFGDIYSSAHLVNSLKKKYPDCKISMLVYSEFQAAAKSINEINSIYTIDRKKILSITNNKLFSDGMAIDTFTQTVETLAKTIWDNVINFSNDHTSAYLTSCISNRKFNGVKYSKSNSVKYSSLWAIIFNDVLTEYKFSNLHHVDCYRHMSNLEDSMNTSSTTIKTNPKHDETSLRTFEDIRKSYSNKNVEMKLIGIQLTTSAEKKNIPLETITELIDKIFTANDMIPILLTSQSSSEAQMADNINKHFNNSLVIVESDLVALPSVVSNLDAIVTPDTLIKHLADVLTVPTIEVALGSAPFRKQGGHNDNNLIVAPIIDCYPCSAKNSCTNKVKHLCGQMIKATDIFTALKCVFNPRLLQLASPSNHVCIHIPKRDELGIHHVPAVGHVNFDQLLSYEMFRQYLIQLTNDKSVITIPVSLYKNIPIEIINKWCEKEIYKCTQASKALLGTIRSLTKLTPHNIENANHFVESLDKLLMFCKNDELIAVPLLLFRANVDSAENRNSSENLSQVESLLYDLKNSIQLLVSCINSLETQSLKRSQEDSIAKIKSLRKMKPLSNFQKTESI
jgi:ADP-heptose:LPS heptosyltransferase